MLERLEKIDSETDNMDVTIVKMGDPRYARKWGVTNLPSVVYFRNRFPSIYRGKFGWFNVYEGKVNMFRLLHVLLCTPKRMILQAILC